MTHDSLCPYTPADSPQRIGWAGLCEQCYEHDCECCQCELIIKVRADERAKR